MENNIGNEIKNGFNALGNAVHVAGKNRVNELVEKQGYVAYKNRNAAELFQNDKEYEDWICKYVDGEYRFYPPKKEETIDYINTFKSVKNENNLVCISMEMIENGECKYNLIVTDKRTGERKVIQNSVVKMDNKFLYETLPSLYYHLCNNLPVIDTEKEKMISFTTVDGNNSILFGGLSEEQKTFIYNMKEQVDKQMHINIQENINR